jgi:hypothetical protein
MPYEPANRYRSPWDSPSSALSTGAPEGGAVMIDGLEVVDEQVVVLSPLDSRGNDDRTTRRSLASRMPRDRRQGVRHGLG